MLFWLYLREERYEEEVKSSDVVVSSLFVIVSILLAVKIGRWRQRGFLSEDRVFEDNFCVGFYVVLVLEIKTGLASTPSKGSAKSTPDGNTRRFCMSLASVALCTSRSE
jgi:hypothetical protein